VESRICRRCGKAVPTEILWDDEGNKITSCKWCNQVLEIEMVSKAYEKIKGLLNKKDELEELIRQVNLYLPEITKKEVK
jgi:Zn-finger protein